MNKKTTRQRSEQHSGHEQKDHLASGRPVATSDGRFHENASDI
jgi:hypothetical protein